MQACYWQPEPWVQRINLLLLVPVMLAVWFSSLAPGYRMALLLACVLYGLLRIAVFRRSRHQRLGLRCRQAAWQLWREGQDWQNIRLSKQSLVLPWLVILYYRLPGCWRSRALVIPARVLSRQEHRRLRVWLRFAA